MSVRRLLFLCLTAALLPASPARGQEEPAAAPPPAQPPAGPPEPRLVLRGFGNVNYEAAGHGGGSQFVLGELDFFLTSRLSEDLSVLAEVAFEPQQEHDTTVDVERYKITWSPSDLVNVAAGRMHTWVGFWNHTYHHGTWLQMTAFRPLIYRFEDDGGILPLHEIGVRVTGTWARPALATSYNVSFTNGRGETGTEVQNIHDINRGKALGVWAGLQPTAVPGLQLGGSLRFDGIPEDPGNPRRNSTMKELIQAAFAVYDRGGTQLLAEYVRVEHREDATARRFVSQGFYVQGSLRLGRARPYYRYDNLDPDQDDPFYTTPETPETRQTAGVRVDPWPWACFKLEAAYHDLPRGVSFGSGTIQLAFTF